MFVFVFVFVCVCVWRRSDVAPTSDVATPLLLHVSGNCDRKDDCSVEYAFLALLISFDLIFFQNKFLLVVGFSFFLRTVRCAPVVKPAFFAAWLQQCKQSTPSTSNATPLGIAASRSDLCHPPVSLFEPPKAPNVEMRLECLPERFELLKNIVFVGSHAGEVVHTFSVKLLCASLFSLFLDHISLFFFCF